MTQEQTDALYNKEVTINLSITELSVLMNELYKAPYGNVDALISKLNSETTSQIVDLTKSIVDATPTEEVAEEDKSYCGRCTKDIEVCECE